MLMDTLNQSSMNIKCELETLFGKENLVYARSENLNSIQISNQTKDFILETGFPHVVSFFRFSMDFEALSKDLEITQSTKDFESLFTIGCQGITQLIGRAIHLQEIGLDKNSNLIDIARKVKSRELDDAVFPPEVAFAQRICIDTGCGGEIKCVNPINLEISFFNSSIEQLAASLATYQQAFSSNISFIESLQKFKTQLAQIDQKALENPENIWVRVIE
jgi:hypothetical protein